MHRIKYDDMSSWIGLNIALLIGRYYWFVWKARGHRNIVRRTMISKIPHENQPKLANDELKENLINACTGTYNCEKVCASDFWCVRLREKVRKCFLARMRERRCAQVFTGAYARPNVCESVYRPFSLYPSMHYSRGYDVTLHHHRPCAICKHFVRYTNVHDLCSLGSMHLPAEVLIVLHVTIRRQEVVTEYMRGFGYETRFE